MMPVRTFIPNIERISMTVRCEMTIRRPDSAKIVYVKCR
jgi:hypothetical protein